MERIKLNYIIDLGLAVTIIIIFITGILRFSDLYRLFGLNYGQIARALPTTQLQIIHDWFGLVFGILALLHFILHWRWWVSVTKRFFRGGGK